MKTHHVWMLAISSLVTLSGVQAIAQNPRQMPPLPGMAPVAAGHFAAQYPVSQAYYTGGPGAGGVALASCDGGCAGGCGAGCDDGCIDGGDGCAACGPDGQNSPGLFRLTDMFNQFRSRGSCDDGSCGNGMCSGGCGVHGYGGYGSQLLGHEHGPFGDGGCCAPRWYDVHAEWMYLKRDDVGKNIGFTSLGVGGNPIVLSTDDLDFEQENGFRLTWAYLVGPGTNVEATYFGTFNWAAAAQVEDANDNLFSVLSDFGTNPGPPAFGFADTDSAYFHAINYSSELNNAEINLRHRWISANCLLHGSWLLGARYVTVEEDFGYITRTNVGHMDYLVSTENDLIGAQLGGDMMLSISPRFKFGGEFKAGVYGARTKQRTTVTATAGTAVQEFQRDGDVAFVGEAGAIGVFRVTPRFSIRGGYQLLFLDGLALASENFNTESPFSPRQTILENNGDIFYHGSTAGFEWTW